MSPGPVRILLIEDNDAHAELASYYLADGISGGLAIERVPTLSEGLEKASGANYDIVLLDLSLPDSGLLQTVGSMKEICDATTLPVVVLTSLDDPEIAAQVVANGAAACISKAGYATGALADCVRAALTVT